MIHIELNEAMKQQVKPSINTIYCILRQYSCLNLFKHDLENYIKNTY